MLLSSQHACMLVECNFIEIGLWVSVRASLTLLLIPASWRLYWLRVGSDHGLTLCPPIVHAGSVGEVALPPQCPRPCRPQEAVWLCLPSGPQVSTAGPSLPSFAYGSAGCGGRGYSCTTCQVRREGVDPEGKKQRLTTSWAPAGCVMSPPPRTPTSGQMTSPSGR